MKVNAENGKTVHDEGQVLFGYVLDSVPVYFDVAADNSAEEGGC